MRTLPLGILRLDRRAAVVALAGTLLAGTGVAAAAAGPKYYFQLREVKAGPEIDPVLKSYAGDAVKADLAGRPEWASDIGSEAQGQDALVAELGKRKLHGFKVTVRLEEVKKEILPPKPGGRLKQLAVNVRLTVFGTTIPEEKLAFSGDGEAGLQAEVSDKRLDAESLSVTKDAIKDAIKQAVDQAVTKLSMANKSMPHNESRHKKK